MSSIIRNLSRADRDGLAAHLLALDAADRRLRFGTPLSDIGVRGYVAGIDFARDAVFGVIDCDLRIVGAAHVARGDGHAEVGLSVLPEFRRRGVGGALLERSAMHARGWYVRKLLMHCLAENVAMRRLAQRQRMRIVTESGESEAWLALAPPDPATVAGEFVADRVGLLDYTLKRLSLAGRTLASAMLPAWNVQ